MEPTQFYSAESTARIEPTVFVQQLFAYRGVDVSQLGLRPYVLLAFIPELVRRMLHTLGAPAPQPYPIQRQTWHNPESMPFSVMTSPMGAPMAVMLLEQLIALGVRRFLYLGFCGAVAPDYRIGDCFIPTQGVREEGTSYHYLPADVIPTASATLTALIHGEAQRQALPVRQGTIWTTDAPYRETAEKITAFQATGVQAVDMEMAALFAVAAYRGCEIGALLIVSDECYHPIWQPGFGAQRLRRACNAAVAVSVKVAVQMAQS